MLKKQMNKGSNTMRNSLRRILSPLFAPALLLVFAAVYSVADTGNSGGTASVGYTPTEGQTSTTMPDGRLLLLGGLGSDGKVSSRAAIYDPHNGQTVVLHAVLTHARSAHTATMLPEGSVLILGGRGQDGAIVRQAERFDPASQKFESLGELPLLARASHTTTVLTDGTLLIAGGNSEKGPAPYAELWDPRRQRRTVLQSPVEQERTGSSAQLLIDGTVVIYGGQDARGQVVVRALQYRLDGGGFEVITDTFARQLVESTNSTSSLFVAESLPRSRVQDAPPDGLVALRFSRPVAATTIDARSVLLHGPQGIVEAKVAVTEEGRLVFVTPTQSLYPGADYTLFVSRVSDTGGGVLEFEAIDFHTAPLQPGGATPPTPAPGRSVTGVATAGSTNVATTSNSSVTSGVFETNDDDESFTPTESHRGGRWRMGRPTTDLAKALLDYDEHSGARVRAYKARMEEKGFAYGIKTAALKALEPGISGVAGTVLRLNDKPLAGVTVSVAGRSARTDENGRFMISGFAAGRYEVMVDGSTASRLGRDYAQFVFGVTARDGVVMELSHPIYLPRVRNKDWFVIGSPTARDTVVTHPDIPGLEIHIPRGTIIRDRAGRNLTQIAIIPVPLDRPPFPTPLNFPSYFMVHPGGALIQGLDPKSSQGVRIIYPNHTHEPPGTEYNFWMYDPRALGWFEYGKGRVSDDGDHIVPNPGVSLREHLAGSVGFGTPPPPSKNPPPDDGCSTARAGDPVDCQSGLFLHHRTDVALRDVLPISLTRVYRPGDTAVRPFGIGTSHTYAMYVHGDITNPQIVLPQGTPITFTRVFSGGAATQSIWTHTTTPGRFHGARMEMVSGTGYGYQGWVFLATLKDGTQYVFRNPGPNVLLAVLDRSGNRLDFIYNGGQLQRVISSGGRYIDLTYDASSRITQIQDPTGRVWSYSYTAAGYLARATYPDSSFEEYTYDASGQMLTVKDRRGNTMVTNEYDASGRVSRQTLADGGVYGFTYTTDGSGNITQTDVSDPRGIVRRHVFHASGYPASTTEAVGMPLGRTTTIERSASGHSTADVDPLGRRTEYTYDNKGNLTSITRLAGTPEAVTESYTYEPAYNQVATHTNALGKTTTYTYDALGRLVEITDPLGNKTSLTYNAAGQPVSIKNAANETTTLTYDFGDLASVADPLGRTVRYFTDSLGRPITITDPAGLQSTRSYDTNDRVVQATDPMGGVTNLAYDASGNLLSVTDPKGGQHQFSYDAKNRLATRVDPLLNSETFVYDGNDNLITYTDRKSQVATYTYDMLDRRTAASFADGTTIAYTFDGADRLTQAQDSQTGTVGRGYDNLDRLIAESTTQGSVSYSYDAVGRRIGFTVAGQTPISYGYDDANRLLQIARGATTVSFAYDAANRRTSLTLPSGIIATYSYDVASQLTGITYMNGATVVGDLSYTYDVRGNRIGTNGSLASTSLPPAVSSAAYDQANRLTNWNGAAITYDANGNMLSDGTRTYAWDSRNRLISIAGPVAASFQYDALGRRIRKTVGGADTAYLYDGLNPVQELNGATPAANLLTGFNLDEFFRRTDSTGDRDIITDALGSTLALADSAGTIQTSYAYDPYGNTAQTGQASTNPFQYTGRENDETGLFYYRARYYSPQLQRFITSDPIGLKGGLNTYTYVRNNPLRWKDPRGLFDDGFPGMGNPLESWLNATNNYVSANPNLGDLFSDTNGNTSGDFRPQDGVCTMGPVSPIGNICVLERCQRHDACYDTSKCNASSWLPTLLGSGKSCPSCNRGFFNPLPASPAPSIDYVAP